MNKATTFESKNHSRNPQLDRTPERGPSRPKTGLRELDRRHNHGLDVRLLWDPQTERVSVALTDDHSGQSFAFDVDPSEAVTAFHHPYAYAREEPPLGHARRGHSRSACNG